MSYENLKVDTKEGIMTIVINRPDKMNALNRATLAELRTVMNQVYKDSAVKGVIITGAGDKAFVAGADISEFLSIGPEEGKKLASNGHEIFRLIELCPKPVVAAVNGFALGGGCELAMACHIRIASDHAKFGQPEVNLGLIPGYGGTQRLIQLIGKSKAMELLMTGDMIKAEEAERLGLVNKVTMPGQLTIKAYEVIEKILEKSPMAIKGIVAAVDAYYQDGKDGFREEVEEFGKCFGTEDFKEGTGAFLEKRKPKFPGR